MRERRGRIVSILLICTLMIGILQPVGTIYIKAGTKEDSTGMFKYYVLNGEVRIAELTDKAKVMEELVIPETIDGYPVTTLGGFYSDGYLFSYDSKVKKISIPNTVTEIAANGFTGFQGETVKLPDSVVTLGDSVFGNSKIKEIVLPEKITIVPSSAFSMCTNLEKITFKGKITSIGFSAFANCEKLKEITLPDSISSIGKMAFYGCREIKQLELPYSIKSVGEKAFGAMGLLESVIIRDKIDDTDSDDLSIGDNPFTLSNEITVVDMNTKQVSVGAETFKTCTKLEKLHINLAGLVGESAFEGLKNIADARVDITNVEYFLNRAFYNTGNLISGELVFGAKLQGIINAFEGNNSITKITINSDKKYNSGRIKLCNMPALEEVNIHNFTGYIEDSSNNPRLKSIYLDVTEIKENGLKNNNLLEDIVITNNVKSIGNRAFDTSGITVMTNVYSDNTAAINYDWAGSHRNITVKSEADYNENPSINIQSKTFKKSSPQDVKFTLNLGKGSKVATNISSVMIDYTEIEDFNYELEGNILTIKKEALKDLNKGSYNVGITFNDVDETSLSGLLTILVIESSSSDSGNNEKPPVALETLSYQFYKDYQRNIIIPIQMNSANTLEELYLGTESIDKDKYSFKNDTIILDKNYLDTVSAGVYRLIPVFDGDKKINNLLLEVYEKYDDRLLPYLLPSQISFKNQDLRLEVELGEGKTKAKDIKLLVIDDMYITPNGEIHKKNPLSYQETATGSAIIQNKMQTYYCLGRMFLNVKEYQTKPAYYLDNEELVLTAGLIKQLGFISDSVHTIGCVFDNNEETASLNRVTLVIPRQQEEDSSNSGDNSNGDSNNSGNQNGGNGNNQGNDSNNSGDISNGNSNNSGNQNGGNSSNQESNSNEQHENATNGKPIDDKDNIHVSETYTLKDIIYNGKSDVEISLATMDEEIKSVKLNGKVLKEEEYQLKGNQVVLLRSTLNRLKDGTNGITIMTKSDIPRTYIGFIQFDFSKQESKIPFMTTYKLLLKGSKFPVYLNNQKEAKKVKWTTSNSNIASVNKKGVLTAKKKGKATITCAVTNKKGDLYKFQIKVTVKDGKKKSFYTEIKNKSYRSKFPVFIMDKLVYQGKTVHIKVSNLEKDSKISFKSSDTSIVTVDKKGNIKGIKSGKATITVTLKQNKETYIYQLQCKCK